MTSTTMADSQQPISNNEKLSPPAAERHTMDLVCDLLNEECQMEILSFLWDEKGSQDEKIGLDAYAVFQFYCRLASVSPDWKTMMDRLFLSNARFVPSLSVCFSQVPEAAHPFFTRWLLGHKQIPIKSMATSALSKEQPWLACRVLRDCHTTTLEYCTLALSLPDDYPPSGRVLLDTLASACPRLRQLALELHLPMNPGTGRAQEISASALFSHPSLTNLSLTLLSVEDDRHPVDLTSDHMFFCKLVQDLPSLQSLRISAQGLLDLPLDALQISSRSLQRLTVSSFCPQARFALDCPRLEQFRCRAARMGRLLDFFPQATWNGQEQQPSEDCTVVANCYHATPQGSGVSSAWRLSWAQYTSLIE